jgi:hypothetical protein
VGAERSKDGVAHTGSVRKDVIVPEAKQAEAGGSEPAIFRRVCAGSSVLPAIEFDDKSRVEADKVGDVRADRVLPAKAMAVELIASQP